MDKRIVFTFTILGLLIMTLALIHDLNRPSPQKVVQKLPEENADRTLPLDEESGLIIAPGLNLVKTNCLGCHSGKLIAQNKGNKETWRSLIRWMQETQNLWSLGENEEKILEYLSTHYAPETNSRRKLLIGIEWYDLEENE